MKLLITGANGQLGLALARTLRGARDSADSLHSVVALDRAALDISDESACVAAIESHQPDCVLNCAAYTAVDRAETERELAFAINETGPVNLAKASRASGAILIHFSTDYVFDGTGSRPYLESDPVAPLGVYGESKLAGERAVADNCDAHLIFRLSWVYSNDGANFYKTMLRLAAERDQLRVVADQFGTPNFTGDLSDAVRRVLQWDRNSLRERAGLYHLSASGIVSWHQFASEIFATAQLSRRPSVEPIGTSDYPTPAKRPAYSALDASRFAATFGAELPDWRAGLRRCVAERSVSA